MASHLEPARDVVEAAQRQDAERGIGPDEPRRGGTNSPVASSDDQVASVACRLGCQGGDVVVLGQLVQLDVQATLAQGGRERLRLELLRVRGQARTGTQLSAGHRIDEEPDGTATHRSSS